MKRKLTIRAALVRLTAGLIMAGCSTLSTAYSSDIEYKPAWLLKGKCGHGSITIGLKDKEYHAQCANLDTHTGKGWFEKEMCYRVEHGKHYDKHRHYMPHKGHKEPGYYKHCVVRKNHYQLPIIKVEKRAYDKHRKLIDTKKSKSFDFEIHTNGGYQKSFHLKSKQKHYVIAPKDHYTIRENAPHYKTVIDCGSGDVKAQHTDVNIDKPGKKVNCIFHNYEPKPPRGHKPPPKGHKPPPKGHKPPPKACMVTGHSLHSAKHNYAKHCHQPRRDCDKIKGKWHCSSMQIGNSAPPAHGKPHHHKPEPKPRACIAAGHSLKSAKHAYARHCSHIPRVDCDPMKGHWYCSSEKIGRYAPSMARW